MNEIIDTYVNPVYFRLIKNSNKKQNDLFVLIHGWLGNEKSMSIFSTAIPQSSTIIYPRGNTKINNDQYGWVDINNAPSDFNNYGEAATILYKAMIDLLQLYQLDDPDKKINLIGFSQGAAICAVLSLLYPDLFNKIALLAGFLPKNSPNDINKNLSSNQYYIAHGTDDQLVPFSKSTELRDYLLQRNAKVQFCEEDIGHKVGKNCLRNLKTFFSA